MWGANYFPNVTLTTHTGEQVKFFDDVIKDKVVAVNFIYTKCSDACPMETARMVEVRKLLGDRLGKDIFFYSISIDPEHDTPEVLATYARNWNTGPGWTFLTGKDEDITLLRKKLGVYEADLAKKDHNLSLIIGNQKTGRWMKRSPYENPYVLANQLGSWLHNWKLPSQGNREYADAPEVRQLSSGEEFFRTRCSSCHTIGGGDRTNTAERRVGPDLYNVTKLRDREWLANWMMYPDKMLEAKDPIALTLLAQYNNVVMPNLRLGKEEVKVLLEYFEEESHNVDLRRAGVGDAGGKRVSVVLDAAGQRELQPVLAKYDALRRQFAEDDLKAAQATARTFEVDDPATAIKSRAVLAALAARVAKAKDLDDARLAFADLSQEVVGLMVDNPALRSGWTLFRCPMAPSYKKWVQVDKTLQNPYWGKKMLTCGSSMPDWNP
ncbi:MAG: SCO family protein [Kofleriaceae bacterium]